MVVAPHDRSLKDDDDGLEKEVVVNEKKDEFLWMEEMHSVHCTPIRRGKGGRGREKDTKVKCESWHTHFFPFSRSKTKANLAKLGNNGRQTKNLFKSIQC